MSLAIAAVTCSLYAQGPARVRLEGKWSVAVELPESRAIIEVPQPDLVTVTNESYAQLPEFNGKITAGWRKGARLTGVIAEECTMQGALDPDSLVIRDGPGPDAVTFKKGADYDADLDAGTVGTLPGSRIRPDQRVFISYRYAKQRIDSIVLAQGKLALKVGTPHAVMPGPPPLAAGETRLANIFISGRLEALTADNLFPILETAYPEPPRASPSIAERRLPHTIAKLKSGKPLKILAWGDSVTTFKRYQTMFVKRLEALFPGSKIELVTEAWGGRNTASYLKEPPGSIHNYEEKVLAVKPDLIVSEFVNDASLTEAQVEERYAKLLADFQKIGAEWIILSPH
jgi:hypothetical protein